nr:MAG TPA: hypothetical protein [Caudoviricetes sp.]
MPVSIICAKCKKIKELIKKYILSVDITLKV